LFVNWFGSATSASINETFTVQCRDANSNIQHAMHGVKSSTLEKTVRNRWSN
jgi:hypothetical protein